MERLGRVWVPGAKGPLVVFFWPDCRAYGNVIREVPVCLGRESLTLGDK